MKRYGTIRFVLRHQAAITASLALLPLVLGAAGFVAGGSWLALLAGVLGAPVAWLVVRLLVEVVDLVADTLIPR